MTRTPTMPTKNALSIRLTESVVLLRGDASGRRRHVEALPPSMLRGLLTLDLAKPTRISSIEIELVGKSRTGWPEGMGARRVEVTEEHKVFHATTVYFRAATTPNSSARRTMSVGPGLTLHHEDDLVHHPATGDSDSEDEADYTRTPQIPAPRLTRRTSVDSSFFQRDFVSHRQSVADSAMLTPPYTPYGGAQPSPPSHESLTSIVLSPTGAEADPRHVLEHSRNALLAGLDRPHTSAGPFTPRPRSVTPLASSSSSVRSGRDAPTPARRISFDDDAARPPLTPTRALPSPLEEDDDDDEDAAGSRGRRTSRFSLSNAVSGMLGVVKDRVRSGSRFSPSARASSRDGTGAGAGAAPREGRREPSVDVERGRALRKLDGLDEHGHGQEGKKKERHGLWTGAEEAKDSGDGWKEFRKGTYTYPISFAIPAHAPPTLRCDYGEVTWRLRATVHRPGAFTPRMTAARDVVVVAAPGEEDTDDTENVIVERQWDDQLAYVIAVSGRAFYVGGAIPLQVTLMPLDKIKVHRISVHIDEKIEYLADFKRVARTDPPHRVTLLHLKRDGGALLPLDYSERSDAFVSSPLHELLPRTTANLNGDEDDPAARAALESEMASRFMGPGPWSFEYAAPLPTACAQLHVTNKNRRSNIIVGHQLKIVFRIERADDLHVDRAGKRKLFDIVVQMPINILSCLCSPDMTSLPRYSETLAEPGPAAHSCTCHAPRPRRFALDRSSLPPALFPISPSPSLSPLQQPARPPSASGSGSPTRTRGRGARPSPSRRSSNDSDSSRESLQLAAAGARVASAVRRPTSVSRAGSLYAHTEQYERLVAGQESEIGEAPPSYEAVTRAGTVHA